MVKSSTMCEEQVRVGEKSRTESIFGIDSERLRLPQDSKAHRGGVARRL